MGFPSLGCVSSITAERWTAAQFTYRNLCGCENGCTWTYCTRFFFFLRERRGAFFSFFFFMFGFVCVCMCAMLVVDLTYVWCSHMFVCLYHCVMRESFFFSLVLSGRQILCCHVCRPDAGRIFQTIAWCKRVCTVCIIWLSGGLSLWSVRVFGCVCQYIWMNPILKAL